MKLLLYATICVHLLLPLMEEPAVFHVPYWVPCCIELICLIIYTLRWINARAFQTHESFKADKKNFIVLVIIVVNIRVNKKAFYLKIFIISSIQKAHIFGHHSVYGCKRNKSHFSTSLHTSSSHTYLY